MKVRKGPILTTKYSPYYIELSNTYSLLAEFLANLIQTYQTTSTEIKFKLIAAIGLQENKNNQINKYIIKAEDTESAIINAAIKQADDECSARNKTTIHQRSQVGKEYSTATHQRKNSITRDGKHVQLKRKPSMATYQQHDEKNLTYDSGVDGHYL